MGYLFNDADCREKKLETIKMNTLQLTDEIVNEFLSIVERCALKELNLAENKGLHLSLETVTQFLEAGGTVDDLNCSNFAFALAPVESLFTLFTQYPDPIPLSLQVGFDSKPLGELSMQPLAALIGDLIAADCRLAESEISLTGFLSHANADLAR
jgi:hypothetical protein